MTVQWVHMQWVSMAPFNRRELPTQRRWTAQSAHREWLPLSECTRARR